MNDRIHFSEQFKTSEMNDLPATLLSHEEVRPQSFGGRRKSTRLQIYRRKLRRRRNRRLVLLLLATTAVVSSVVAYKVQHPEFTFQQFVPEETLDLQGFDRVLQNAANKMETIAQQVQEAIEQGIATLSNITSTNMEQESVASSKENEKSKREPVVKVVEEIVEKVLPVEVHPEPDTITPELGMPVESKEEKGATETIEDRPALCNLPLSYLVHRRCWRLSSRNPVFNLHGLVQDMMQ